MFDFQECHFEGPGRGPCWTLSFSGLQWITVDYSGSSDLKTFHRVGGFGGFNGANAGAPVPQGLGAAASNTLVPLVLAVPGPRITDRLSPHLLISLTAPNHPKVVVCTRARWILGGILIMSPHLSVRISQYGVHTARACTRGVSW